MMESKEKPTASEVPPATSVADDLRNLYDQVTEFNDCCTFLCDTFVNMAAEEDALETTTVEGLKCLSHWMKQRVEHVKLQIKEVQEKSCSTE